jgi:hypothetical protein
LDAIQKIHTNSYIARYFAINNKKNQSYLLRNEKHKTDACFFHQLTATVVIKQDFVLNTLVFLFSISYMHIKSKKIIFLKLKKYFFFPSVLARSLGIINPAMLNKSEIIFPFTAISRGEVECKLIIHVKNKSF